MVFLVNKRNCNRLDCWDTALLGGEWCLFLCGIGRYREVSVGIWFWVLGRCGIDKRITWCYTFIVDMMLYIKEGNTMIQQISDAELEIMKIVWGNPEEVTLFSYIMDGLADRGKPCQKNTLIVLLSRLMNKGFLSAKKIGRRNEYMALVSEMEYQTAQTKNFLDKIYEGNVKGLVSNLIFGDLLEEGEYEELKRLLEEGKEKR